MFFPFGWTLSWEVQSQGSRSEENESQALKGRDSQCNGEHFSDGPASWQADCSFTYRIFQESRLAPLSGPSGLGRDNNYFFQFLFPLLKGGPWGFKAFMYFRAYLAKQIDHGSCFKGNFRYTRWKARGSLQSLDLRHKSTCTITWRLKRPRLQVVWGCSGDCRWLQHQQLASWFQKEHR